MKGIDRLRNIIISADRGKLLPSYKILEKYNDKVYSNTVLELNVNTNIVWQEICHNILVEYKNTFGDTDDD